MRFTNFELSEAIAKDYEDFIQKVMTGIDNLVPSKNKLIKDTSKYWFDAQIMGKKKREREISYYKKSKNSCLHLDKDNHNETRNEVEKIIRKKEKAYFESKLTEKLAILKKYGKT